MSFSRRHQTKHLNSDCILCIFIRDKTIDTFSNKNETWIKTFKCLDKKASCSFQWVDAFKKFGYQSFRQMAVYDYEYSCFLVKKQQSESEVVALEIWIVHIISLNVVFS